MIDRMFNVGIERDCKLPENTRLEVCLPKDFVKNFSINTTTGVVKIDSTNLNSFILTTNSGGMKVGQLIANEISITTVSGSIRADKLEAKKLDIQSKTASVNIDKCLTESAQIVTTTGSITLRLSDTAEFLYEARTTTGKLRSQFHINTNDNKKITGKNGEKNNQLVLQTSTGNISLLTC